MSVGPYCNYVPHQSLRSAFTYQNDFGHPVPTFLPSEGTLTPEWQCLALQQMTEEMTFKFNRPAGPPFPPLGKGQPIGI